MELFYSSELDSKIVQDAKFIRNEVFIEEQKVPKEVELDDHDEGAIHFVLYDTNSYPVATMRVQDEGEGVYHYQRVAVRKSFRGKGLGRVLVSGVENNLKDLGAKKIYFDSQDSAMNFYITMDYKIVGPIHSDSGIPHHRMEKYL